MNPPETKIHDPIPIECYAGAYIAYAKCSCGFIGIGRDAMRPAAILQANRKRDAHVALDNLRERG